MHLFTVADTFFIQRRGLILVPGVAEDVRLKRGDRVELRFPDGASKVVAVAAIEFLCGDPPRTPLPVLMPPDIKKEDVPIGTEVWSVP